MTWVRFEKGPAHALRDGVVLCGRGPEDQTTRQELTAPLKLNRCRRCTAILRGGLGSNTSPRDAGWAATRFWSAK